MGERGERIQAEVYPGALLQQDGPDILRVEGIVFLRDIPTPFVLPGVQHVFDPPVLLTDWPGGDRRSRIVVIARDISRPEFQRSLDMLRGRPAPDPYPIEDALP